MTIPASGPLTLGTTIRNEFGVAAAPFSLSHYYRGGFAVNVNTAAGPNGAIPTSGTISMSKFRGVTKYVTPPSASLNIVGGPTVADNAAYTYQAYGYYLTPGTQYVMQLVGTANGAAFSSNTGTYTADSNGYIAASQTLTNNGGVARGAQTRILNITTTGGQLVAQSTQQSFTLAAAAAPSFNPAGSKAYNYAGGTPQSDAVNYTITFMPNGRVEMSSPYEIINDTWGAPLTNGVGAGYWIRFRYIATNQQMGGTFNTFLQLSSARSINMFVNYTGETASATMKADISTTNSAGNIFATHDIYINAG